MFDIGRVITTVTKPFVICIALISPSLSQAGGCPQDPNEPCIALVLGGGGARGGAHVGVLRALEESRVPVHIITGTSIGSFIGGLYASGKSPDEIEAILANNNWARGLGDQVSREDAPLRRKQQADNFPIQLGLGFDGSEFKFSQGVSQGQRMGELIQRSVGMLPNFRSFDDLPIQYRAIAADLETGEEVVLESGSLVSAMQASMSIPGVIKPLEHDGRLLVDGGVANNLPVSVAKSLGADIVIAVEIGTKLPTREELTSAVSVLNQLVDFLIKQNVNQQISLLEPNDILLQPRNDGVDMLNFDGLLQSIPVGYNEADNQRDRLNELSLDDAQWNQYAERRQSLDRVESRITSITVNNNSPLRNDIILERLDINVGDETNMSLIQSRLNHVYALDLFERADYSLNTTEEGQELVVDLQEKSWGPGYLDFTIRFEDDFSGNSQFEVGGVWTLTNLNDIGAEWRTAFIGGTDKRLRTELYLPFEWAPLNHYWTTGAEFYRDYRSDTNDQIGTVNYMMSESSAWLGTGWNFNDRTRIEAGYFAASGHVRLPIVQGSLLNGQRLDYSRDGFYTDFIYDSLDSLVFPRKGHRIWLRGESSDDEIANIQSSPNTFQFRADSVGSWGDHTVSATLRGESFSRDDLASGVTLFELGGFMNLSGLPPNSIAGNHLRYGNVNYRYQLLENDFGLFKSPVFVGATYERGNVWSERSDIRWNDTIETGAVYLGIDSPIGPIFLAYGRAEGQTDSLYFYLGSTL